MRKIDKLNFFKDKCWYVLIIPDDGEIDGFWLVRYVNDKHHFFNKDIKLIASHVYFHWILDSVCWENYTTSNDNNVVCDKSDILKSIKISDDVPITMEKIEELKKLTIEVGNEYLKNLSL